jgi:hypothetical protein
MFGYESVEDFLKSSVADLYQNPAERKDFVEKCSEEWSSKRSRTETQEGESG